MVEKAFPHIRNALRQLNQREPDILKIKLNKRKCEIIEVIVCFDLYMDTSYREKGNKYQPLINFNKFSVMYFGSLGTVHKDWRGNLKKIGLSGEEAKETMKWCSVSNMICGSIVWRNRCKKAWTVGLLISGVVQGINLAIRRLQFVLNLPNHIRYYHYYYYKFHQFGFYTNFLNSVHWFQFADDAAVVTGPENENQILLNHFSRWCSWANLHIRVDRC